MRSLLSVILCAVRSVNATKDTLCFFISRLIKYCGIDRAMMNFNMNRIYFKLASELTLNLFSSFELGNAKETVQFFVLLVVARCGL